MDRADRLLPIDDSPQNRGFPRSWWIPTVIPPWWRIREASASTSSNPGGHGILRRVGFGGRFDYRTTATVGNLASRLCTQGDRRPVAARHSD
jgi:hypothetical protein